ncbi:DNA-directed DNA polymerase [Dispira simplex]|nr:DNA-directed DNA polymerase [Dispira simplex]
MSQNLLPLFWDLASIEATERHKATTLLLRTLGQFQMEFVETHGLDPREIQCRTPDDLTKYWCPDVVYTFRRLMQGLSSPRKGARQGFGLALTELLQRFRGFAVDLVVELLNQTTVVPPGCKGQEERDFLFGRLFGYLAIIQSGMLTRSTMLEEDVARVVQGLLEVAHAKSFLLLPGYQALICLLRTFRTVEGQGSQVAEQLVKSVLAQGLTTAEALDAVLTAQRWYPELDYSTLLPNTWHTGCMLALDNIPRVEHVLLNSWAPDRLDTHAIWHTILAIYFPTTDSDDSTPSPSKDNPWLKDRAPFHVLWDLLVENGYSQAKATVHRKATSFLLFGDVLRYIYPADVSALFTPELSNVFFKSLNAKQESLHKAAQELLKTILKRVQERPSLGFPILTQLYPLGRSSRVPKAMQGKTLDALLLNLSETDVSTYVTSLMKTFVQPTQPKAPIADEIKDQIIDKQRQTTLEELLAVVTHNRVRVSEPLYQRALAFYVVHGFFVLERPVSSKLVSNPWPLPTVPISDDVASLCREHCLVLINSIPEVLYNRQMATFSEAKRAGNTQQPITKPTRQNTTVLSNGETWAQYVLQVVKRIFGQDHVGRYRQPLDQSAQEALAITDDTLQAVHDPKKKKSTKARLAEETQTYLFDTLLSQLYLLLLHEPEEYLEVARDVRQCYEKAFNPTHRPVRRSQRRKTQTTETNGPLDDGTSSRADSEGGAQSSQEIAPVDVLLDIVISFLSKAKESLSLLAYRMFTLLAEQLTPSAINLLFEVLLTQENSTEEQELFEMESDQSMDMEEMTEFNVLQPESGSEADEDHIVANADGQLAVVSDSNNQDEEEEDSDVEDLSDDDWGDDGPQQDNGENAAMNDLRQRVQDALGDMALNPTEEDNSSDEELLDDDQMMAFDAKLSEIFAHRKSAQKEKKQITTFLVTFKCRVLELVTIFLKGHSDHALVPECIVPLMDLVTSTGQSPRLRQIHQKAMGILRSRIGSLKVVPQGVEPHRATEITDQVLKRAKLFIEGPPQAKLLTDLCLYLIRIVDASNLKKPQREMAKAVQTHATRYLTSHKGVFPMDEFMRVYQRFPFLALHESAALVKLGHPQACVNSFRTSQTYLIFLHTVLGLTQKPSVDGLVLLEQALPGLRDALTDLLTFAVSDQNPQHQVVNAARLRDIMMNVLSMLQKARPMVNKYLSQETGKAKSRKSTTTVGTKLTSVPDLWNSEAFMEALLGLLNPKSGGFSSFAMHSIAIAYTKCLGLTGVDLPKPEVGPSSKKRKTNK